MHVLESKQDLGRVKLSQLLREAPMLKEVEEKFATGADIHYEEEFIAILERPMQFDQKWVIELLEDATFAKNRFYFVLVEKLVLLQYFYRVKASCINLAGKDHLTKSASSNHFDLFEVFDCNFTLLS